MSEFNDLGVRKKKAAQKLASVPASEPPGVDVSAPKYPRVLLSNAEGSMRVVVEQRENKTLDFIFEKHTGCAPSGKISDCTWEEVESLPAPTLKDSEVNICIYAAFAMLNQYALNTWTKAASVVNIAPKEGVTNGQQ